MTVKTFRNPRGEIASTDGTRWWAGADADETSISLNALQPVSALFPSQSPADAAAVARSRAVFISALRKTAPTVSPSDDAERAILRKAWDDAQAFAASRRVLKTGVPVFDAKLMVVGAADVLIEAPDGTSCSYCYAPDGYEYAGAVNAVTRILLHGFPIACTDDPYGLYSMRDLCRALMALTMRNETEWAAKKLASSPF